VFRFFKKIHSQGENINCIKHEIYFFIIFFKRFIAQKINEIHRVTKLRNCSFALVVPRWASDRECTVLGYYEYSSEKQVQRKNTAAEIY